MKQSILFTKEEIIPWLAEWKNMPEYNIQDLAPKFQIIVNFGGNSDFYEKTDMCPIN